MVVYPGFAAFAFIPQCSQTGSRGESVRVPVLPIERPTKTSPLQDAQKFPLTWFVCGFYAILMIACDSCVGLFGQLPFGMLFSHGLLGSTEQPYALESSHSNFTHIRTYRWCLAIIEFSV